MVSDSALERFRLQRRLRGAGADAERAVDPWAAEAELARRDWDVVVWAAPRHEGLGRSLLAHAGPAATLLVVEPRAATGRVADALDAGFEDVVRAGVAPSEIVVRAMALARRARRRADRERRGEAFRELAEGSRDLLMRIDPDGVVLFASAAAREVLGREPRELQGRRILDLCHPDERGDLLRTLEGESPPDRPAPVAHRLRTRRGGWVWMETTVRSVRDPTGRLSEAHTDSRDVTERMRVDAERAALARVTAAVAGGEALEPVCALVARDAVALSGAESGAVVRLHGDEGLVTGAAGPAWRVGDRVALAVAAPRVAVAPVTVADRIWGVVMTRGADRAPGSRLQPLADLLGLAVANRRARERLVALATTDPLTGLANHRTFHHRLQVECGRVERAGGALALVMIDLDHFKRVNDTHGHPAGDAVLREVARRLRARSRGEDVVARIGGEELAWLLPGAGPDAAAEAAERLRRDIRETRFAGVGRVTASMGVAGHGADGPAGLLRRADLALYRAKEGGRDACVRWDEDISLTAAPSG